MAIHRAEAAEKMLSKYKHKIMQMKQEKQQKQWTIYQNTQACFKVCQIEIISDLEKEIRRSILRKQNSHKNLLKRIQSQSIVPPQYKYDSLQADTTPSPSIAVGIHNTRALQLQAKRIQNQTVSPSIAEYRFKSSDKNLLKRNRKSKKMEGNIATFT